ncbi:unnamed protein product [Leptosia nina]|uniref:Uncharacterized protein n=1 Tax=Leptosia nina TaxID=320188 RepID=A0AAV1JKY8_9NEOP
MRIKACLPLHGFRQVQTDSFRRPDIVYNGALTHFRVDDDVIKLYGCKRRQRNMGSFPILQPYNIWATTSLALKAYCARQRYEL